MFVVTFANSAFAVFLAAGLVCITEHLRDILYHMVHEHHPRPPNQLQLIAVLQQKPKSIAADCRAAAKPKPTAICCLTAAAEPKPTAADCRAAAGPQITAVFCLAAAAVPQTTAADSHAAAVTQPTAADFRAAVDPPNQLQLIVLLQQDPNKLQLISVLQQTLSQLQLIITYRPAKPMPRRLWTGLTANAHMVSTLLLVKWQ